MSETESTKQSESKIDIGDLEPAQNRKRRYRVILDEVRSEVETADSFSLKFSLLASLPVTKVKHMIRSLPANVWVGTRKSHATALLTLIGDAGGKGRIVEEDESAERPPADRGGSAGGKVCSHCGFPLKKDDQFCSFCMSPVDEVKQPHHVDVPRARKSNVPFRYLFILFLVVVAAILAVVLRG